VGFYGSTTVIIDQPMINPIKIIANIRPLVAIENTAIVAIKITQANHFLITVVFY
jgi:hypothetical protein